MGPTALSAAATAPVGGVWAGAHHRLLENILELRGRVRPAPLSRLAVPLLEPARAEREEGEPAILAQQRQRAEAYLVEMSLRNRWAASMSLIDLSAMAKYTIWFFTTRAK